MMRLSQSLLLIDTIHSWPALIQTWLHLLIIRLRLITVITANYYRT